MSETEFTESESIFHDLVSEYPHYPDAPAAAEGGLGEEEGDYGLLGM